MSRNISTTDQIWKILQDATGEFFVDDFRERMAKDDRLWKLAKQDASSKPLNHLTTQIIQEYERYKMSRSHYISLEDRTTKRKRHVVPGGNAKAFPESNLGTRFPTDPCEPISSLLNAMARREYQPAMEAIITIESEGRIAFDAKEFANLLSDIATLENKFVGQALPSAKADKDSLLATYKGKMDAYMEEGSNWVAIDKEANLLELRVKLRKYMAVAKRINAHIDVVIAKAEPSTAEILQKADLHFSARPEYRVLRVLNDWTGGSAIPVAFHRECRFLAAIERLCAILAAHYGWMEEHALVFIFAGASPPTGSIRVHYRMRHDIPCQSRIILELEPSIPIETVMKVFELARRHVLPGGAKPRMISTKSMALAGDAFSRGPGFSADEMADGWKWRMDEWNRNYAPHLKNLSRTIKGKQTIKKQSTFDQVWTFKEACNRAREALLNPKYKIVNSEGFFIAGTELPALKLLKPPDES